MERRHTAGGRWIEANNRVLIWNNIPTSNGTPADVVIGQADFTSSDNPEPPTAQSFNQPGDVASDGTSLFVEDSSNNRILVFSPFPTSSNLAASVVLGQADFTHSSQECAATLRRARRLSTFRSVCPSLESNCSSTTSATIGS